MHEQERLILIKASENCFKETSAKNFSRKRAPKNHFERHKRKKIHSDIHQKAIFKGRRCTKKHLRSDRTYPGCKIIVPPRFFGFEKVTGYPNFARFLPITFRTFESQSIRKNIFCSDLDSISFRKKLMKKTRKSPKKKLVMTPRNAKHLLRAPLPTA